MRRSLLASLGLACVTLAHASGAAVETSLEPTLTELSRLTHSQMESTAAALLNARLARDWGLKPEEWVRYQHLMQGPLGIESPHLDPLTALGIEARSDAERQHYAELEVQMEGRRVAKILEFQRAYDAAWKRLYPNLKPVDFASVPAVSRQPETSGTGRLAVFVKEPCPACDSAVRALATQGRDFDIYMVGLEDDTDIRAWAARVGIDPNKVRAGAITLNHDAGRWLSVGDQGGLPAVLANVDGQWQRE